MEQFVILLVVGAIGLVKWVLEKSAEQRAKRETEERIGRLGESEPVASPMQAPRPVASFPSSDEAARRLRKALGLPDESELPRRRQPVFAAPQEFRVEEFKSPPAIDLERRTVKVPPPFPEFTPTRAPSSRPVETVSVPYSGLDELLRSREGLRKAILVQEILGTPKGLVF